MRLYNNIWCEKKFNKIKVEEMVRKYGLSFSAVKVLLSMNMNEKSTDDFLNPRLSTELNNTEEAVEMLEKHIVNKSKILIFGDYDVDGMSASALLYHFFKQNNVDTKIIIPNRYLHGYGLNAKSLELVENDVDLVITVDCGITSVEEVEFLKKKNIDVIITDHHEKKEIIPDTVCLNPKVGGGYINLAGAGVALKFALSISNRLDFIFDEELYMYAMLGTIADVMALLSENRYIVKKGLEVINSTNNKGIKALINKLKLNNITSTDIGFKICPILNASGRLGQEIYAVELLTESNNYDEVVEKLIELNNQRKEEESNMVSDVLEKDFSNDYIVIDKSANWKKGVLGLGASRISNRLKKPCILFNEDVTLAGSARSYGDFNLLEAIDNNKNLLIRYGGHKQAAGLELSIDNYTAFKNAMNKYLKENSSYIDEYVKYDYIDIELNEACIDTINSLKDLEPFGVGNSKPIFRLNTLNLVSVNIYGKNNNFYVLNFMKDNVYLKAIYFSNRDVEHFIVGKNYDIIFEMDLNEFNNKVSVQLKLIDYRILNNYFIDTNPFLREYYIDLANSISNYSTKNISVEFIDFENIIKYEVENKEEFHYCDYKIPNEMPNLLLCKDIKYDKSRIKKNIIDKLPNDDSLRKAYLFFKKNKNIQLVNINNYLGCLLSLKIFNELDLLEYEVRDNDIFIDFKNVKKEVLLKDSKTYIKTKKILEDYNGLKE